MPLAQSNGVVVPSVVEDIPESVDDNSVPVNMKASKWKIVKAANAKILPRASQGEIKLNNLINELQKVTLEQQEKVRKEEEISARTTWDRIRLFRRRLANFLQQPKFHYIVILLVITDLIVVLIDLVLGMFRKKVFQSDEILFHLAQLSSPCLTAEEMEEYNTTIQRDSCILGYSIQLERTDLFLFYFSVLLLSIFVFEVFISFYAFGWKYFTSPLYLLDGIIVLSSFIMELYFHYGNIGRAGRAASAIILLRLWKIVRAIHAVAHSITIKNRLLIERIHEAQILLEGEKQQAEETLEKQEIKLNYLIHILTNMGKLPSTKQIEKYVHETWIQRKKTSPTL